LWRTPIHIYLIINEITKISIILNPIKKLPNLLIPLKRILETPTPLIDKIIFQLASVCLLSPINRIIFLICHCMFSITSSQTSFSRMRNFSSPPTPSHPILQPPLPYMVIQQHATTNHWESLNFDTNYCRWKQHKKDNKHKNINFLKEGIIQKL